MPARLILEPPPAYLVTVPDDLLDPSKRIDARPERLICWLRGRGIAARPTLEEIEAERVRLGMRNLDVWPGSALPSVRPRRRRSRSREFAA